jgi:hypothetical protein
MGDELFSLVDDDGWGIGSVSRRRAHGDPSLVRPVGQCLVASPLRRAAA